MILRKKGAVTVREWQKMRNHATADDARRELLGFEKAGLGRLHYPKPKTTGGPPSALFTLNHTDTITVWTYCQGGFYEVAPPAMNLKNAQQVKKVYKANLVRAVTMKRSDWLIDYEPYPKAREQLARDHLEDEFMGWAKRPNKHTSVKKVRTQDGRIAVMSHRRGLDLMPDAHDA